MPEMLESKILSKAKHWDWTETEFEYLLFV